MHLQTGVKNVKIGVFFVFSRLKCCVNASEASLIATALQSSPSAHSCMNANSQRCCLVLLAYPDILNNPRLRPMNTSSLQPSLSCLLELLPSAQVADH